jgi:hypothetical protein
LFDGVIQSSGAFAPAAITLWSADVAVPVVEDVEGADAGGR